jgi:hypothetical protein
MNGPDNNGDKLRFDLIPSTSLKAVAAVITTNQKKYPGVPQWVEGVSFESYYGAILRHLNDWHLGEDHDPDGFHHLAGAAASILILLDMAIRHKDSAFDDRPPSIPTACPVRSIE